MSALPKQPFPCHSFIRQPSRCQRKQCQLNPCQTSQCRTVATPANLDSDQHTASFRTKKHTNTQPTWQDQHPPADREPEELQASLIVRIPYLSRALRSRPRPRATRSSPHTFHALALPSWPRTVGLHRGTRAVVFG
eukprot:1842869-Rhodomonas_salina.5